MSTRPLLEDPAIASVTIALNYRCQSACRFCFIEPEIGARLPDTDATTIDAIFAENRRTQRYGRLILAGAEATLREDLPELAWRARREGGFRHVRLQTNGRRLADRRLLLRLLAAGIDEWFVSVHGGTPEDDLAVTRSATSFPQLREGLRNLRALGATTLSNTVVSRSTLPGLTRTVDFLVEEGVPESHFWAFIEFGDVGQAEEHVPFAQAVPALRAAITRHPGRVVLSWFPVCLLGDDAARQVNHRDDTRIHDAFVQRVQAHGRFDCPHAAACPALGAGCYGLHERHRAVIGDEADVLRPLRPAG